jgi:aminomethyltransferase
VEITGPDAFEFTNMLTPRDLTKCEVGQCKYALITFEDGNIINDPILLRLGEKHFWLSLSDGEVLLWAKGLAAGMGMNVEITEPDVSPMQVQGPRSKDVIGALFGDEVANLRYYYCAEASVDGIPAVVSRTGWTGEVGYEIYLRDGSRGDDLWDRVMEAGRPHDIRVTGPNEIRRVEAGIFNFRSDFTYEHNPFEIMGFERLVEEQDADYMGKAALERVRAEGVERRLVGIEIDGDPHPHQPEEYWPALSGGERVGHVTAVVWSPRLERNIGFVWVPAALSEPGTALDVEAPFGTLAARTAALPFVDPRKRIPLY